MSDNDRPKVFIQWKSTNACIDLYCTCDEQLHFDGYFAAELTCGNCGQTYELPHMLKIKPVEPSRPLNLIFDKAVIEVGMFKVTWPRPVFGAVRAGEAFDIHDAADGTVRSACVKLLMAQAEADGTVTLTVQNTGVKP